MSQPTEKTKHIERCHPPFFYFLSRLLTTADLGPLKKSFSCYLQISTAISPKSSFVIYDQNMFHLHRSQSCSENQAMWVFNQSKGPSNQQLISPLQFHFAEETGWLGQKFTNKTEKSTIHLAESYCKMTARIECFILLIA